MIRRRAAGFTLIELLVVIVIIAILLGILIPVISKVRQSAYAASSAAMVSALDGAIKQYQMQYNAFPGPVGRDAAGNDLVGQALASFPPANVIGNLNVGHLTGTENLVLGLLGGLKYDPAAPAPGIVFDWQIVGQGPRSLSPRLPQKKSAFIEGKDLSWTDGQTGTGQTNEPDAFSGFFADAVTPMRATAGSQIDSAVPEFVDRFPSPMPILYLRAQVGAGFIIANGAGAQYNIAHILAYTDPNGTFTAGAPPAGVSIGVGKKFDEYQEAGVAKKPANPYHGLRTIDVSTNMKFPGNVPYYFMPADAFPYFRNDALSSPGPDNTWGTPGSPQAADDVQVPRQKDGYILISAGKDRVYGTDDDITNFGPVK